MFKKFRPIEGPGFYKPKDFYSFQNRHRYVLAELPTSAIKDGKFNIRSNHSPAGLSRMAQSMSDNGQLVPIRVRRSTNEFGSFELICGHRRVSAAKSLGWETVKAEIVETTDLESIQQSLIENFEREELSDYEKGMGIEKLNSEFGLTYEQIGKMLGISRQHVSGYVSMTRLFDHADLRMSPELAHALHQVSEHHSRILSRIEDKKIRMSFVLMIAKEGLSVRDLTNITVRLRSWFKDKESVAQTEERPLCKRATAEFEIEKIILRRFELAKSGDFQSFKQIYSFGEDFNLFASFPTTERLEGTRALEQEKYWFYKIMPKLSFRIQDLKITVIQNAALASFKVFYALNSKRDLTMATRATIGLRKKESSWYIFHEHWSRIEEYELPTNQNPPHIFASIARVTL